MSEQNVISEKVVSEDFETEEISDGNTENHNESETAYSSNQTSSESEASEPSEESVGGISESKYQNAPEKQAEQASEVIKTINFENDSESNSFEMQDLVEPRSGKQLESESPPPPLPAKKVTRTRFKLPEKQQQLTRSHSSEFTAELECKSQTRTASLPDLDEILMGDESMDEQSYLIRTHGLKTRTFDLMIGDDRKYGGGNNNNRRFRDVDMTGIDITEFEPCAYREW